MDNNTRRYPRTLTEAFGPYADGPIHDSRLPRDWAQLLSLAGPFVLMVLAAALLIALALHSLFAHYQG